jgi:hypothetical protein
MEQIKRGGLQERRGLQGERDGEGVFFFATLIGMAM